MAIEKTILTVDYSSNPTGAAEEVANWLEANAADLFDTISVGDASPTTNHILCNIDDIAVLNYFQGDNNTAASGTVSLKNGTLKTLGSASNLKQAYTTMTNISVSYTRILISFR